MRSRSGSPAALVALALVALGLVSMLGACSDGESPFAAGSASACSLVERLGSTAETLEQADPADPEEFQAALDDAVLQFTGVVDALLEQTPDRLHDDLRAMRAAAEQLRFSDAVAARAALDDWARDECGLLPVTTTTPAAPSSTT